MVEFAKPSGAANRKQYASRMSAADKAEEKRRDVGFDPMEILKTEPPPDDAVGLVVWVQQLAAKGLHGVTRDPAMTFELKLKYISELGKMIGQGHSKAVVEEKIQSLERKAGVSKATKRNDGLQPDPEA